MRTILTEFDASLECLKNNFYFSFLSLNFISQRPFYYDIVLPLNLVQNIVTAKSLNEFDEDGIAEYLNSIRRHFLNDLVIAYERYSTLMITSHINNQIRMEPETFNNRNVNSITFENLADLYKPDEIVFLTQLRRLRNCIVHFNGRYAVTNKLLYTFGKNTYNSVGKEGEDISIEFESIVWIFDELKRIVSNGNANYFLAYPKN